MNETMAMETANGSSKRILQRHLVRLLGFDDGIEDMLEHLLTIESSPDLLDYMTQLLGADQIDELRKFVTNVGIVQIGGTITDDDDDDSSTAKLAVVVPTQEEKIKKQPQQKNSSTVKQQQQQKPKIQKNKKPPPSSKVRTTQSKSSKATTTTEATTTPGITSQQQTTATQKEVITPDTTTTTTAETEASVIRQQQQPKSPPKKGTATQKECGCYGTKHTVVTNCLYCGRISCSKEGGCNDYCHFCGYYVEEAATTMPTTEGDDDAAAAAWQHKERLLRYDREFAQRTVIIDDQADYYNDATSAWLTESEQGDAKTKEQQRSDAIHKRQNVTLKLDF